ncbi:unnamed protein product [Rhizoctonia solani]|uniref:Uncharacterized protein n=1 Tax=Rhizoctonia solani TaxID=456999 RepID=A0A8H3H0S4_9AGAM|nr:unnamed protein product [Rhizoctonia solani]
MNTSNNSGVPSILLWALGSNLLSISGIIVKDTIVQFESKLLAAFTMVCLPLVCYGSALVSLRSRSPYDVHRDPMKPLGSGNRMRLVGWGTLSIIALVQRYLVVVMYMEDALKSANERVQGLGVARAICSFGLLETWIIFHIIITCWKNTQVASDELPDSIDAKKTVLISSA